MLHQLPSFDVSHTHRSHLGETARSLWGTSSIKRRIVLESRNALFRQIKAGFMGVSWLCHCFKRLSSPGTWNERRPEKHVLEKRHPFFHFTAYYCIYFNLENEGFFSQSPPLLTHSIDGKSYAIRQECATLPSLQLSSTQERAKCKTFGNPWFPDD